MMKATRYVVTALLCYAAFWGAAHVGMLPVLRADTSTEMSAQATAGAKASSDMWRSFFVIR